jgi:alpha-ketoglutarate-dependent taurine dioxygenase
MHIALLFSSPDHPVVISPEKDASFEALCAYLEANAFALAKLLHEHGGILFRGFHVNTAEKFDLCAQTMGATPFGYAGGNSPRKNVAGDVYTSTEYPASESISLHNEMSYLPEWPKRLFFYCAEPARTGGQTSLASNREILRKMPDDITAVFRKKKIKYIRNFHPGIKIGKTWQSTYCTESQAEVERIVAQQKSVCRWGANGSLQVSTLCDAFASARGIDGNFWFNQAEQWHPSSLHPEIRAMLEQCDMHSHDCEFEDGEPFEDEMLDRVRGVLNSSKLLFNWQRNDVLVIDNMLTLHGREPFSGTRKTLAYLSAT